MNTALPLFVIGLVFGGGIGFTIAAANGITLDGHDHADPAHHHGNAPAGHDMAAHDHDNRLVLPAAPDAPTLAVDVVKDPAAGWNLNIKTTHFDFAPHNASRDHVAGEGHAHIYVNGEKLGRYYGPWVHLDGLPPGDVAVEVTLNANDHRILSVGDKPLSVMVKIQN